MSIPNLIIQRQEVLPFFIFLNKIFMFAIASRGLNIVYGSHEQISKKKYRLKLVLFKILNYFFNNENYTDGAIYQSRSLELCPLGKTIFIKNIYLNYFSNVNFISTFDLKKANKCENIRKTSTKFSLCCIRRFI